MPSVVKLPVAPFTLNLPLKPTFKSPVAVIPSKPIILPLISASPAFVSRMLTLPNLMPSFFRVTSLMVPSVTTSPLPFTAKYAFSPTLPTVRPVSDHTLPCALTLPSLSTFTRPSILVTPFSRVIPATFSATLPTFTPLKLFSVITAPLMPSLLIVAPLIVPAVKLPVLVSTVKV